ncbi:MAG TPA: hypothetical protein VFK86_03230 [Bauldia sp.]|nr:hypothetical protein [Bauldia sp.]
MTTRRDALVGLGAVILAGVPRRATAANTLAFDELYAGDAVLAKRCRDLTGQAVEMVGFMAPPLKAEADFFVLTSMPMAVCPFCETEAQWPDDIVLVITGEPFSAVPFNRPIRVRGTLETGFLRDEETGFVSLIRLVGAEFERL